VIQEIIKDYTNQIMKTKDEIKRNNTGIDLKDAERLAVGQVNNIINLKRTNETRTFQTLENEKREIANQERTKEKKGNKIRTTIITAPNTKVDGKVISSRTIGLGEMIGRQASELSKGNKKPIDYFGAYGELYKRGKGKVNANANKRWEETVMKPAIQQIEIEDIKKMNEKKCRIQTPKNEDKKAVK